MLNERRDIVSDNEILFGTDLQDAVLSKCVFSISVFSLDWFLYEGNTVI